MELIKPLFTGDIVGPLLTIIIGIVLYYFGGLLISYFIKHSVAVKAKSAKWRKDDIVKRQDTLSGLSAGIWKILVVVVVVLTITKIVFPSVSFAPIFASAGILGVALGFGAQSVVKDFLSGLFIVVENQYRVGDIVQQGDVYATVERIGARSTVMRDFHGNLHYFPNGLIGHTVNMTNRYSVARFTLKIQPDSDIEKVIKLVNSVGEEIAQDSQWKNKIIEAPSFRYISDIDGLAVAMVISGKTRPSEQWYVEAELRRRLLKEFKSHSINLAMPIPPALLESAS